MILGICLTIVLALTIGPLSLGIWLLYRDVGLLTNLEEE